MTGEGHQAGTAADSATGAADRVGAQRWWRAVRGLLTHVVLAPVHLWRSTAPMRAPRCRFHPTCSTYALEAVGEHGPLRGTVLAVRRVGRCHPWNLGGIDPVPAAEDRDAWRRRYVSGGERPSN